MCTYNTRIYVEEDFKEGLSHQSKTWKTRMFIQKNISFAKKFLYSSVIRDICV